MSDLIKRSDAIEAVKRISENYTGRGKRNFHPHIDFLIDELKYEVPSTDRLQGEWIPCSERLPKENTEVLMSLEWGVDIGEYRNGEWHSEWINHYDDGNVLAWMPLPKPWKGADDE